MHGTRHHDRTSFCWFKPSCLMVFALFAMFCGGSNVALSAEETVSYEKDVKALFRQRCFACHGALKQEAGLRLDTVELMIKGGDSGAVIQPGTPAKSLLLERVSATEEFEVMPPHGEGERLSKEQIAAIRKWIAAGAPAPTNEEPETDPNLHWAFQPILRPEVPQLNSQWVRNPIDAFVARRHQEKSLTPTPEPSRLMLQRRLYIDLVGVPPSLEEIADLKANESPNWYAQTVDKLLEDPRYGERWGRHWMDIWRYSDWWGLGKQMRYSQKHIWHWRDWIIESLNDDLAYDEMVRLMLAADELAPNDLQKLRASGYMARNWMLFNRDAWMDEIVEHVGKGFLGLTMNCAKCHDHKFDPISHREYYSMRAFFEPYHVRMDRVPGEPDLIKNGIPRAFDSLLEKPTYLYLRGNEATPDKSEVINPGVPAIVSEGDLVIQQVELPPEAWQPVRRPWIIEDQLAKSAATLLPVQKALDEANARLEAETKLNESAASVQPGPIIEEDFTTFDQNKWRSLTGKWTHNDGKLHTEAETRGAIRFLEHAPRDFDATIKFRLHPGGKYQSIGLGFDVTETTSQLVYASGGGNKVQAAYDSGSGNQYPGGDALHIQTIDTDQDYVLRIQAKGELITAFFNGNKVIHWRSPQPRKSGAMELVSYAVSAEIDEVSVTALSSESSLEIARDQVKLAEMDLEIAKAKHQTLERRAAATQATWNGEAREEIEAALRAEMQVSLLQTQRTLLEKQQQVKEANEKEKAAIEKQIEKSNQELAKTEKQIASPIESLDGFEPLRGAEWTPTRFASSAKDDLPETFKPTSTGRRTALAKWITDPKNPLTARVAANHIWARHLGSPIVASVFDFGRNGSSPTHPELLDWLAFELIDNGWSMKHLHRVIVNSSTYRMGSSLEGADQNLSLDEDNRQLWRRTPIRMESQVVRDSILSLSGELDLTMGGPTIPIAEQVDSKRRSLYFFHSNNERNLFLTMFDEAAVRECYQREQSVVPQQALALSNSKLVLEAAPKIVKQIDNENKLSETEFVREAFAAILGIDATEAELTASLRALSDWSKQPEATPESARAHFIWALLNHNDFVTLR